MKNGKDNEDKIVDNNDRSRTEPRNQTDDERRIGLTTPRPPTEEDIAEEESASRAGIRRSEDMSDIGDTDSMRSATGGLAGTSR